MARRSLDRDDVLWWLPSQALKPNIRFQWPLRLLAAVAILCPVALSRAALPDPTARLGTCQPSMVNAGELFARQSGLKVVVVRFVGQGEASERLGADLGYSLSQALPDFINKSLQKDSQTTGLSGDDLQVRYVPCLLSTHRDARSIGGAWGADMVFWGQVTSGEGAPVAKVLLPPVVAKGAHVSVQVNGDIKARGRARIGIIDDRKVTVNLPVAKGQFSTSVTLVKWRGVEEHSDRSARLNPTGVQDLTLPQLATERPMGLFRFAVGIYAYYRQRYAEAAALFEDATAEIYAGSAQSSDLYSLIGTSCVIAGQLERGLAAFEQMRTSCGPTDARCQASALNNLGWAVSQRGEQRKALSYYELALPLHKQMGDRVGEAATLNNIGSVYLALGEQRKALSYLEPALSLQQQTGNRAGVASTLNNIGSVYQALGEQRKALSYFEQALALHRQVGNRAGEAPTLNNTGSAYKALGELQKALSYYEQALALQRQVGDRIGEAATLNNTGSVYQALGEQRKALSYYEQALVLRKQVGDRAGEAAMLNVIGGVYYDLGEHRKALSYYEQALPLRKQVGDHAGEAVTLHNTGSVYQALGEQRKALGYYEQALALAKQVGNRAGEASTLNIIGTVYQALGEQRKALSYYEQALLLRKQVGDRAGEAVTLNNIGTAYYALGEQRKALSYYEQALPLRKQAGNRASEATTLVNMGAVYNALGDKPNARIYYQQALTIYEQLGDRKHAETYRLKLRALGS